MFFGCFGLLLRSIRSPTREKQDVQRMARICPSLHVRHLWTDPVRPSDVL